MPGDLPSDFGVGSTDQPPMGNWSPKYSGQPARRSRPRLAIAVAVTAAAVFAALIAALTRSTASNPSTATSTQTYGAAETAAAQQQLRDTHKLVARAVGFDTSGNDRALARIADTNGAVMLDIATANPALDANQREAARSLATAYGKVPAMGSSLVASDSDYRAALDDVTAKDAAMMRACAGG